MQKSPEFLAINPNGRIPALIDDSVQGKDRKGNNVFESAAVMMWSLERYDKENRFWFEDQVERSKTFSWMFFVHGGIGPMQGQRNHFKNKAPEKLPYAIKRYSDKVDRLYSVLEDGLSAGKGKWLVGDKYSAVDINAFGWLRSPGVENMRKYPKLQAWNDRIKARPGVASGLAIPKKKS